MKKLLLFLAVMTVLLSIACSAAEPGFVFAPFSDRTYDGISPSGDSEITFTDTYLTLEEVEELTGENIGDPFVVIPETNLDAKYEWIKMRVRNRSGATQFEMHFASTATDDSIVAESCTHYPISSNDTDFVEYIFNVKQANLDSQSVNGVKLEKSVWEGKISTIRLDCMWMAEPSGQMPKGSKFDIDYVAFFETEADAKAYVPEEKVIKDYEAMEFDMSAPYFVFDNEDEIARWSAEGCSVSFESGNMKMVPGGWDPQLTRRLDTPFSGDTYPYMAYRYKAFARGVNSGGIFFTSDYVPSFTGQAFTPWALNVEDQWTNVIIDMSKQDHGKWTGNINALRVDALNGQVQDMNAAVYINRLGFFKTEEDAKAFLAHGKADYSQISMFTETTYKTIIPGGVMQDGMGRPNFDLESTITLGQVQPGQVVMYTSDDGAKSIVALSDTFENGYTTYVANKPGSYTIGTNHKEYVDIAGHWGEQYINFVSDRALFGGTSPTEFSPEVTMTRGMFITVLGRMHGVDTAKYSTETGYTDVPAAEYYAPYIMWAKEEGIMAGTSDTTFAPEEPITRATMAVVIDNYTKNSGYTFSVYKETEGFTDLAGLDDATVNAINTVKNVGIINGKGNGLFDPNGISTRAEVATVMQRVIKAVLGTSLPAGAMTHEEITRDRIRLGVWRFNSNFVNEKGMKELIDLGVDLIVHGGATAASPARDTLLNYADVYGIEVYMQDYYNIISATEENVAEFLEKSDPVLTSAAYAHHPSFNGHFITDEPGTDSFEALGKVVKDYETTMPGKRAFVNLLPMYANAAQLKYGASAAAIEYYDSDPELYTKHCEKWFETTDSNYICTDIYPLLAGNTYTEYVESINQIARVARERDADFMCCIQAHTWASSHRNPTEAEVRWQCYSVLSFGCNYILLWDYIGNTKFPGIMDTSTNEPTANYYACKPVMWEMRELSDTFVKYKNLGAFTHNANKPYLKMTGEYEGFDTIKEIKSDESFLIGCFEAKDGSGATAFTIVNMEELLEEKGATATITVDPTKKVTIYNRGKAIPVENDGTIDLTFECGDGFFITVE